MARPRLIPQEDEVYGICSVLQGILASHGVRASQKSIACNLAYSGKGYILGDERIKAFIESHGLDYTFYEHNATPFNEPDMLLEKMSENEGFIGIGLHVYRLLSFTDSEIIVDDPEDARRKKLDLHKIMDDLAEVGGGFGLIKKIV